LSDGEVECTYPERTCASGQFELTRTKSWRYDWRQEQWVHVKVVSSGIGASPCVASHRYRMVRGETKPRDQVEHTEFLICLDDPPRYTEFVHRLPEGTLARAKQVVMNSRVVCILDADGAVECAPLPDHHDRVSAPAVEMHPGDTRALVFSRVAPLPPVTSLLGGALAFDMCASTRAGEARCWSAGRDEEPPKPPEAVGPAGARAVASGWPTACVIEADQHVACGDETVGFERVAGIEHATSLVMGREHGCAIADGRGVWCWETHSHSNADRVGTCKERDVAVPVTLAAPATELWADGGMTCARVDGDAIHCWGSPERAGTGQPVCHPTPIEIELRARENRPDEP
jgi:hypothetical protein